MQKVVLKRTLIIMFSLFIEDRTRTIWLNLHQRISRIYVLEN